MDSETRSRIEILDARTNDLETRVARLEDLGPGVVRPAERLDLAVAANRQAAQQQAVARDPWAHRSAKMRCATCMWFVEKAKPMPAAPAVGRCRRHAPTMGGYPVVLGTDWCGDHKLDEAQA